MLITEVVFDSDQLCYCTGRFSAARFGDANGIVEEGPQAVLIEEALAWAQSSVIVVRVGPGKREFSAGSREPAGRNLRRWPAGGLPEVRHSGTRVAWAD